MTAEFEIDGQKFVALNGGPHFKFNEAVSFQILCKTQAEVDHFWEKLAQGGNEGPCGWLKDKFGLSWQVVPTVLPEMLQVPGFVAGRRYTLTGPRAVDGPRFLAVYEIETDDLAATLQALSAAAPTMTVSDAMDQPATIIDLYEVLTERRTTTAPAPAPKESDHSDHPYPRASDHGAADPAFLVSLLPDDTRADGHCRGRERHAE